MPDVGTWAMEHSRLSKTTLEHFRAVLEEQRVDLEQHRAHNEESLVEVKVARDGETDDEHDPEGPTIASEWSRLTGLQAETAKQLTVLDKALARIETAASACARAAANRSAAPASTPARSPNSASTAPGSPKELPVTAAHDGLRPKPIFSGDRSSATRQAIDGSRPDRGVRSPYDRQRARPSRGLRLLHPPCNRLRRLRGASR